MDLIGVLYIFLLNISPRPWLSFITSKEGIKQIWTMWILGMRKSQNIASPSPTSYILSCKDNSPSVDPLPPASASVMESIGTFKVLICRHGKLTGTVKVRCWTKSQQTLEIHALENLTKIEGVARLVSYPNPVNYTTNTDTYLLSCIGDPKLNLTSGCVEFFWKRRT